MSLLHGVQSDTYSVDMDTDPHFPTKVARSVAAAIEAAGESTKSVADATGIARVTLIRRLTGTTPFTVAELALIARYLDTTPDKFMTEAAA